MSLCLSICDSSDFDLRNVCVLCHYSFNVVLLRANLHIISLVHCDLLFKSYSDPPPFQNPGSVAYINLVWMTCNAYI